MMLDVLLRDCQQMNSGTGFRILDCDIRNCLCWTMFIEALEMPIFASKSDFPLLELFSLENVQVIELYKDAILVLVEARVSYPILRIQCSDRS